jgi:glyceraldehyde-3-phosphate dehydrogenase/erythrose-4-phosphate dehydrogenase
MSDTSAGSRLNLAINEFGRIGRSFLRAALEYREFLQLFNIVAINDTADAKTLAHLFKYDSTFGKFEGKVIASNHSIQVDGIDIRILQERRPSVLPWKEMRIDLVLESTGKFKEAKEPQKHIQAGTRKVIISAPAKDRTPHCL